MSGNDSDHEMGLDAEDAPEQHILKLQSKDGDTVTVARETGIKFSGLIRATLDGNNDEDEMPVPPVGTATLRRIVSWMEHHATTGVDPVPPEQPLRSNVMKDVCKDEWDANFVDAMENVNDIYAIILASNYMEMDPLNYLCCAKLASLAKGRTPAQIEEALRVKKE